MFVRSNDEEINYIISRVKTFECLTEDTSAHSKIDNRNVIKILSKDITFLLSELEKAEAREDQLLKSLTTIVDPLNFFTHMLAREGFPAGGYITKLCTEAPFISDIAKESLKSYHENSPFRESHFPTCGHDFSAEVYCSIVGTRFQVR